jgi:acyl carrier protein
MSVEARVIETVRSLLARYGRTVPVTAESRLYADGLGLDSLGAAELSTMLEMAFGRDPYSEGVVPRSVEEIVRFYDTPAGPR